MSAVQSLDITIYYAFFIKIFCCFHPWADRQQKKEAKKPKQQQKRKENLLIRKNKEEKLTGMGDGLSFLSLFFLLLSVFFLLYRHHQHFTVHNGPSKSKSIMKEPKAPRGLRCLRYRVDGRLIAGNLTKKKNIFIHLLLLLFIFLILSP